MLLMALVPQISAPEVIRRIRQVQVITIAWMSVEAAVSLFAAWRASSPALLAFGGDNAIELFSAVIIGLRICYNCHKNAGKLGVRVAENIVLSFAALVS